MTTNNLWIENAVVNGSIETMRDIVWMEGQDASTDMPTAIMLNRLGSSLPSFVTIQVQIKWLYRPELPPTSSLNDDCIQKLRVDVEEDCSAVQSQESRSRHVICNGFAY
jgi:hypothetical protein